VSLAAATWEALGSRVRVVVTDSSALAAASAEVEGEIAAIDRTCSRFRPDAELARVNAADGVALRVSPRLAEAVGVALDAARRTGGLVDPTVGAAMIAAGYDRDFDSLPDDTPGRPAIAAPGWESVRLNRRRRRLQLAPGTRLDLGATAKALAADRAAAAAAAAIAPHGVLVNLGGDLAVAGTPPAEGWPVGIADGHRDEAVATTVALRAGGLATSSTTQRRWRRDGREMHHVLDPRSGEPAPVVWRTVSVVAGSCVLANTASTAALVIGADAPSWLAGVGLPARLVRADGTVTGTCGWSTDKAAA
jgi:thiamine biosynthesis lipoprotein